MQSILAPGITSADSTAFTVAPGAIVTVGIYASSESVLPNGVNFTIMVTTPGAKNALPDKLSNFNRQTAVVGPGEFVVHRPAYSGSAFGVYLESGS